MPDWIELPRTESMFAASSRCQSVTHGAIVTSYFSASVQAPKTNAEP